MNRKINTFFYIVTGIFTAHMLFTVVMYFFNTEMVSEMFVSLGVPPEIIFPLGVAKLLGLVAIWTNKSRMLKQLAYLGFALDFVFASAAHGMAGDGQVIAPLVVFVVLAASYFLDRKRANVAPSVLD